MLDIYKISYLNPLINGALFVIQNKQILLFVKKIIPLFPKVKLFHE